MIPIQDLGRGADDHQEMVDAVERVIRSGKLIHGPEHSAFEHEFAEFIGSQFAHGVANGTDALELALRAVGCVAGSTVISVANAGGYTSIAAQAIGCKVIYCDTDSEHLVMDPESLLQHLSESVTAVVVTHLFGNVAPVGRIVEMCKPFGIRVIEDCAQSIGAKYRGQTVGSIGDVGTFSFYPTKNLGGFGDGGALTTSNPEYSKAITSLRQYGWKSKYQISINGGMNSRLDEIQAAVLRIRLRYLPELNKKRQMIVSQYAAAISETSLRLITSYLPDSAPHLAVVNLPKTSNREDFRLFLENDLIQTDIHYPILDFDQIGFSVNAAEVPVTLAASKLIVSIPLFPEMYDFEVQKVCSALSRYGQKHTQF
jgi:dTDP-4-amino-4,6-dideoxygalactose transaminase